MDINAEWAPNQADAEPTDHELIQQAQGRGYTRELWLSGGEYDLNVLVKPDADLDGAFRAFCLDECEYLRVNG
jgi:hypothetical protein